MNNTIDYEKIFSGYFPFWNKLDKTHQDLLCTHTAFTFYKRGQNIHGNEHHCTGAILVKSGQLRTYILSDEGREITLYRLYPGDICMLSASCVLNAITFDVFVDCDEDSEVYIINPNTLATVMESNIYAKNFALNITTSRFSDVMWAMQQILFMSFDKRLAIFLIDELANTDGNIIHLTHEQIAKYMGSAREVVSRMLKYFASEKLVELSRGGIKILDKNKLRDLTR
ncbi:hypothetical protein SDC9_118188 [bioreactor metagenome]|uniref:HTH crp-type domain-containing protein n=1 Tax=bioreactor metagenome TaxID=1076179 RepID=A0A645C109_9ZZZZ